MNEVRKASVSKFFTNFTPWHRAFMKELAEKYKAVGKFPFIPIRELAMSYRNIRDMEVAALVGLMVKEGGDKRRAVREFRLMMGESPWEWFRGRSFALLSTGARQEERIGGSVGWKIAAFLDGFANHENDYKRRNSWLYWMRKIGVEEWKIRTFQMVMVERGGVGLSLWANHKAHCLLCPNDKGVREFVKLWMPEFRVRGGGRSSFTFDEAVRLYGFRRDLDFFYAYLGWKELCRRNPRECSRYTTTYQKRYNDGSLVDKFFWLDKKRGVFPEIDFSYLEDV